MRSSFSFSKEISSIMSNNISYFSLILYSIKCFIEKQIRLIVRDDIEEEYELRFVLTMEYELLSMLDFMLDSCVFVAYCGQFCLEIHAQHF